MPNFKFIYIKFQEKIQEILECMRAEPQSADVQLRGCKGLYELFQFENDGGDSDPENYRVR